jgi:hypothetical protein
MPGEGIHQERLANPGVDEVVLQPDAAQPSAWVCTPAAQVLNGQLFVTVCRRGPEPWRGDGNEIYRLGSDGQWQLVFTLSADDAPCTGATGTVSLGSMDITFLDGLYYAVYCALDAHVDPAQLECWSMWVMSADDPARFDPSTAERIDIGPGSSQLRNLDGGVNDPRFLSDSDETTRLYFVGWDDWAGPATTYRAEFDGHRFLAEPEPVFPAHGCAAAAARLTGTLSFADGRRLLLLDVERLQLTLVPETGVWLWEPAEGLSTIDLAGLPRRVAGRGESCRSGSIVEYGDEILCFYEAERRQAGSNGEHVVQVARFAWGVMETLPQAERDVE